MNRYLPYQSPVFFWDALTSGPLFKAPRLTVSRVTNAASNSVYKVKIEILLDFQHLTALRDWLLPMLMNGQVTVR